MEEENSILVKMAKNPLIMLTKLQKIIYHTIKRIFDIFCSLVALVMLIPFTIIIKILYLATGDTKPIFYKQKRIGKGGKRIYIYKFRSMVYNADELLNELLTNPEYEKQWKSNQKIKNDPRITPIGKILRKTCIDELPQFVNVLKGEMSLIGPRPLIEGELDKHNGNHQIYESIKPGITGWWACNRNIADTYEKRLSLEYYYCKHCNLILDIKCIFKTIKIIIWG